MLVSRMPRQSTLDQFFNRTLLYPARVRRTTTVGSRRANVRQMSAFRCRPPGKSRPARQTFYHLLVRVKNS